MISLNADKVQLPGISDIIDAARRLEPVAVRTPLLESERLNQFAGRRILVKAECMQRGGSFKFRGAWNHLWKKRYALDGRSVIAVSSGNHGAGVARAAWLLGIPAAIVMPHDTPEPKAQAVRGYGAEIIGHDRSVESREAVAAQALSERNAHFLPPFDDALVIAGQGTVGLEISEDVRRLRIEEADVLVPCSGGGLASGCALYLEAGAPGLTVRPVEPEGFDDWSRSLATGTPQANDSHAGSLCDALLVETPGRITWAIGQRRFGPGIIVPDSEALRAMALAWQCLRVVLEPSGAISLGAALSLPDTDKRPVVVVASGGNVDHRTFSEALAANAPLDIPAPLPTPGALTL